MFGKWHVQPAPYLPGFDYSLYPRVHHRHARQTFVENRGEGEVVEGFSVDYEARRVREYLHEIGNRPFFLVYSISPPHVPLDDAPDEYRFMYHPEEVPLRSNVYVNGELPYDEHWFKIYLWDIQYCQEHQPHTEQLRYRPAPPHGSLLRDGHVGGGTTWSAS